MAVTANQLIKRQEGEKGSAPVEEATRLYQGTLAFFNAAGYLVGIVASGANPFAGVMIGEADNTSGADGDINGSFWQDGDFEMTGSGFSQATVGLDIFASDNYTVTTSNSSTSYVGRCVGYISSTKIIVSIKKNSPANALAADASGTTAATFTVDTDVGKPRTALASQTGGTGDFTAFIKPPATLGADRIFTLDGDAAATIANIAGAQTLTSKTLSTGTKDIRDTTTLTPDAANGAGATMTAGLTQYTVAAVTNDANDWVTLPAIAGVGIGHTIIMACNAGGNFELRTPGSSNTKINDVDSDGSAEYLCTDTDVVIIRKATTTGWVAQSITKLGAVRAAVVPDA